MKRDDDYIRQMLLDMEASKDMHLVAPLMMSMTPDEEKQYQSGAI